LRAVTLGIARNDDAYVDKPYDAMVRREDAKERKADRTVMNVANEAVLEEVRKRAQLSSSDSDDAVVIELPPPQIIDLQSADYKVGRTLTREEAKEITRKGGQPPSRKPGEELRCRRAPPPQPPQVQPEPAEPSQSEPADIQEASMDLNLEFVGVQPHLPPAEYGQGVLRRLFMGSGITVPPHSLEGVHSFHMFVMPPAYYDGTPPIQSFEVRLREGEKAFRELQKEKCQRYLDGRNQAPPPPKPPQPQ
jgi:hypothetical protein